MIENTIPILNVADLAASCEFYESVLGFAKDWVADVDGDKVAGISCDGSTIYLCEGSQGVKGSWIWMGVEEESYFAAVIEAGATIVQEATNYPWAYELRIADLDGNVIRLGTEPR